MNIFLELIRFIFKRKKFWLAPVLIIMIIIGGLLVLSQGSVLAPFIYTIF